MDKYKIDSHKLIYHVGRVNDWINGRDIYPIYLEISPSGSCNHRCIYCALDFMEYQSRFLETSILKERLYEMARLGVKSIMYAGEGEPFLHKEMSDIITSTKNCGIDAAITSNGVFLNGEVAECVLTNCTWVKISINAATKETYAKVHRTKPTDFEKVIKNLSNAAKIRKAKRHKCTLGMQIVLLPENCLEVISLAKKARDIGMDYLVVKPYSQHPFSKTTKYKGIRYGKYLHLADKLKALNTENFKVIFRINTMKKWDAAKRNYAHCLALPFWSYIDASGNLWGCSAYLGDKRFIYGNIYRNSFQEIWKGARTKRIQGEAQNLLDTRKCRLNCRMDEINRYLWDLKNLPEHANFI